MPFDTAFLPPSPSSPEVQVLRRAMSYIDKPEHWCQRSFHRNKRLYDGGVLHQHCAVGAIEDVSRTISERRVVLSNVFEALAAEIKVPAMPTGIYRRLCFMLYGLIWTGWRLNRHRVILFNDLRITRHADVMGLFQRAIERLEMQTLALVQFGSRGSH